TVATTARGGEESRSGDKSAHPTVGCATQRDERSMCVMHVELLEKRSGRKYWRRERRAPSVSGVEWCRVLSTGVARCRAVSSTRGGERGGELPELRRIQVRDRPR